MSVHIFIQFKENQLSIVGGSYCFVRLQYMNRMSISYNESFIVCQGAESDASTRRRMNADGWFKLQYLFLKPSLNHIITHCRC